MAEVTSFRQTVEMQEVVSLIGCEELDLLSFRPLPVTGLRPIFQMIIWGAYFHVASSTTGKEEGERKGGLVKSTAVSSSGRIAVKATKLGIGQTRIQILLDLLPM